MATETNFQEWKNDAINTVMSTCNMDRATAIAFVGGPAQIRTDFDERLVECTGEAHAIEVINSGEWEPEEAA